MSSYDCPRCNSSQTNTFESAYEHGTRTGNHSGGGHYVSQSAFAQQSAPPASPQLTCGALMGIVMISGAVSFVLAIGAARALIYLGQANREDFGTTMLSLFMLMMFATFLLGIFIQSRIIKSRMGGYKRNLQQWNKSMICRRCNYTWIR